MPPTLRRPEILSPAGDLPSLRAALAAGADAVYFGLDDGFNARARAANFASSEIAPMVAELHRGGAKAYVTLNTLVFEPELPLVAELIARCGHAGVDALIVQDPAVAQLARAICPTMEVHASTQMTVCSPLAAEFMKRLGLARVVVPRELSVEEIREFAAGTSVPLEVFIHGALCVSWSGQCLSSETWGGRSANRGQCAQACRLPYELVVDGETRPLGDVAYLLSPADLVGSMAVAALAEIGVASLKIEGRLKGPAYVATATAHYRAAAAAAVGETLPLPAVEVPTDAGSMYLTYSRGASAGFLGGANHQTLVEGRFGRHRGLPLGRVVSVRGSDVLVETDAAQRPSSGGKAMAAGDGAPHVSAITNVQPTADAADAADSPTFAPLQATVIPEPGMGAVFDAGHPDEAEQGGPIFAAAAWRSPAGKPGFALRFGQPGPDLTRVAPGNFVWINSSPELTKVGARAAAAGALALGRLPVALTVTGAVDQPLVATATAMSGHRTFTATAASSLMLTAARGAGISEEILRDKLGSFGGTSFHLGALDTTGLAPGLHIPVSAMKDVRRHLMAALEAQLAEYAPDVMDVATVLQGFAVPARITSAADAATESAAVAMVPLLVPLCRTDEQLNALLDAGVPEVELDWMEFVGLGRAVERAKARGTKVVIATTRIQKPGEQKLDAHIAKLAPDGVLVRNWGSMAYFLALPAAERPILHGDFSLNVTNSITARWVLEQGLTTATCAHDLDTVQLQALLDACPAERMAVTIHHHIPTFHTEHCVYAHLLSHGADYRTCGRPCETQLVALRDRVNMVHPVVVDVGCRNTIFNAQAQSAARLVGDLVNRGVARLRIELVRETANETLTAWLAYRALLDQTATAVQTLAKIAAQEQFGVTAGTMRTLTVLHQR